MKKFIITAILVIGLVIGISSCVSKTSFNDHTKTVTVTKSERVTKGDSSKYLIFCEDETGDVIVFQNTDDIFRGKYNSSDLYAQIEVNKKYTFTLVGYRVPFMSWYENILEIDPVNEQEEK